MSQNDGYTPLTGVVPIPVSTEPLPCRLPPRVYDRKQGHDYPRYAKGIKIALRGLMMQEPPKGRRYSKEALDHGSGRVATASPGPRELGRMARGASTEELLEVPLTYQRLNCLYPGIRGCFRPG